MPIGLTRCHQYLRSWTAMVVVAAATALAPMSAMASGAQVATPQLTPDKHLLAGYKWLLVNAYDSTGQVQPEWQGQGWPQIPVYFHESGSFGVSVCNSMNWRFVLAPNTIQVVGYGASTLIGCDEPLSQLQQRAYALFSKNIGYQLAETSSKTPRLSFKFADGSRWELYGEPTPSTKYGSDGTTVLLEVDGPHVNCQPNKQSETKCLRVRQVDWGVRDGKGIFLNQRPWRTLPLDAIDNYIHRPDWHGVLTIRQFDITPNKPGGPAMAYLFVNEYTDFRLRGGQ